MELRRVFGLFEEQGVLLHPGNSEGVGLGSYGDDELVVGQLQVFIPITCL